jgi:hypothetical protein
LQPDYLNLVDTTIVVVVEGKSGEEIGLKQCVSHHLPWWCMVT